MPHPSPLLHASALTLQGWGRNKEVQLLHAGTDYYYTPVQLNLRQLDPSSVKNINGGTTAASNGVIVTCTCTAALYRLCLGSAPLPPPTIFVHKFRRGTG
jgi:hypothetical protein